MALHAEGLMRQKVGLLKLMNHLSLGSLFRLQHSLGFAAEAAVGGSLGAATEQLSRDVKNKIRSSNHAAHCKLEASSESWEPLAEVQGSD